MSSPPPTAPDTYEILDPQPVDGRKAAELLLSCGVDPANIASQLNMPVSAVRAIATFRFREPASEEEVELRSRFLDLADHCIDIAWDLIDHGPYSVKVSLVRLVLGTTARQVARAGNTEGDAEMEEFRLTWEQTASTMRDVPHVVPVAELEDFEDDDDA